jgi:DNA-binding MarR family transcriptional regulator
MHAIGNSPEAVSQRLVDMFHALMKSSQGPVFELSSKFDLTLSQLKILMILGNSERALALHEIAEASVLSLPAAGRAVDALLRHDLVSRREDVLDRRVKRVELTQAGRKATGRVAEARLAAVQEAVSQLTADERAAFASALEPLAANVASPQAVDLAEGGSSKQIEMPDKETEMEVSR